MPILCIDDHASSLAGAYGDAWRIRQRACSTPQRDAWLPIAPSGCSSCPRGVAGPVPNALSSSISNRAHIALHSTGCSSCSRLVKPFFVLLRTTALAAFSALRAAGVHSCADGHDHETGAVECVPDASNGRGIVRQADLTLAASGTLRSVDNNNKPRQATSPIVAAPSLA